MKHISTILPVVLLTLAITASGCKLTPREAAVQSLRITQQTVHASMLAFADYEHRQGEAMNADQAEKVWDAHERYRRAFDTAIELVRFDYSAPTPSDVGGLAAELIELVSDVLEGDYTL